MKTFLLFLFVWIASASPLILLTSFIEFRKAYILFDVLLDLLKALHPIPRYILIGVLLAFMLAGLILLVLRFVK